MSWELWVCALCFVPTKNPINLMIRVSEIVNDVTNQGRRGQLVALLEHHMYHLSGLKRHPHHPPPCPYFAFSSFYHHIMVRHTKNHRKGGL